MSMSHAEAISAVQNKIRNQGLCGVLSTDGFGEEAMCILPTPCERHGEVEPISTDPQEILDALDQTLTIWPAPDAAALIREQITRIADLEAQLAEFDAAPVTDARIWDQVRDAIEHEVWGENTGPERVKDLANRLTTIALGERVET